MMCIAIFDSMVVRTLKGVYWLIMMAAVTCGYGGIRMEKTDSVNRQFTVGMVDNDARSIASLREIIEDLIPRAAVIWSVTDGTDAVSRCLSERGRPDIVLVDMSLEGMPGPTVCRIMREHCSMMPIVAMTAFSTNMYRSIAARAGAQGIVGKNSESDFVEGIHEVICGRTYGGQLFESAAMACARVQEEQRSSDRNLTQQEILVMELLAENKDDGQIASELSIVPATVRKHIQNARRKLHAKNRFQAALMWITGADW